MAKPPKAVAEATELAERLHQETYGVEEPEGEDGEQKQEAQHEDTSEQHEEHQAQEPTPPEPDPVPEEKTKEDFEQRYRSLKGKYDAEVPRLTAENRTLRQENQELQTQVSDLTKRMEALEKGGTGAKEQPDAQTKNKRLASDEDIAEYGEEFTAFLERIAQKAAQESASNLTPTIEELRGEVTRTKQSSATQTVKSQLDTQVPDWRRINRLPEFLGWLSHEEPMIGQTRQTLLSQAYEAGNAPRVVAIFKQFASQELQSEPQPAPAPQQQPAAEPAPATNGKLDLEQLAGPRASTQGGPPQEKPREKTWTGSDIKAFYDDVQKGAYKTRPEDKARIEAQIGKALAEGRVQR